MKIVGIKRRDLIDWPSAKRVDSIEYEGSSQFLGHWPSELVCVYDEREQQVWPFPRLILVQDGRIRDFLAWAATYLPFRPITAFVRVVDRSSLLPIARPPVVSRALRLAIAGAVLGEALQSTSDREPSPSRTLADALMSHSFVCARALARGCFPLLFTHDVANRTRRLLDEDVSVTRAHQLWARIADLVEETSLLFAAEPEVESRNVLNALLRGMEGDFSITELIDRDSPRAANREARVRQFEHVTANLRSNRGEVGDQGMLQGFLADRIAPGSFEHASLLQGTASQQSGALSWYGFFAGLNANSKIGGFGGGVIWRLVAAIFESDDVIDRPPADIGLDELEMLVDFAEPRAAVAPKVGSVLCVEVLPTVYSYRTWMPADGDTRLQSDRLSELGAVLAEANAVYSSLVAEQRKPARRPQKRKR